MLLHPSASTEAASSIFRSVADTHAGPPMMAPPRPLTLRDFLEIACDSSSDGFRSYPRRLPLPQPQPQPLLADLRRSPSSSSRSPSSLFSLPRISSLSRSFSRRIKEGFWRRRFDEGDDEVYLDDRDSCGFPSPLVSSCSASDSEADDVTAPEEDKPASAAPAASDCEKASSTSSGSEDCTDAAPPGAAAGRDKMQQAVAEGDSGVGRKLGMEDKQQLSPVSVLDFPFDDDDAEEEGSDAGTCSPAPAFQRRPPPDLRQIRPKQGRLHKVRRYDPVDLDARFVAAASESGESVDASTRLGTSSSSTTSTTDSSTTSATATTAPRHDDEEHQSLEQQPPSFRESQEPDDDDDEYRLLARLLEEEGFEASLVDDEASRALVLDFFAEVVVVGRLRSAAGGPVEEGRRVAKEEGALVRAAAEWLRGAGPRWGIADVVLSGKAALADMERGRRWMCADEEERDVGAAVEGDVVDALVDELVAELVVSWWCHDHGRRWKWNYQ